MRWLFALVVFVPGLAFGDSLLDPFTKPQPERRDYSGFLLHLDYAFARNVSPIDGSTGAAYVSTITFDPGFIFIAKNDDDAFAIGGEVAAMIGHDNRTTREPLAGGFLRATHSGVYVKLGAVSGFSKGAANERRTLLVDVQTGITLPIDVWAPVVGLGMQLGQTQDDGFVAIFGISLGIDRYLPFHECSSCR